MVQTSAKFAREYRLYCSDRTTVSVFLALLQRASPASPNLVWNYTERITENPKIWSLVCVACPRKRVYNAIGESVFLLF
jgi:hypothetical protein